MNNPETRRGRRSGNFDDDADLDNADRLPVARGDAADLATDMQPPARVPLSAPWFVTFLMMLIFTGCQFR